MAKQPWNRFDTAKEFGETLQKACRNEPIALFDPVAHAAAHPDAPPRPWRRATTSSPARSWRELEAEGHIDPQITLLRAQIDQVDASEDRGAAARERAGAL